jgi:hypothetical protein
MNGQQRFQVSTWFPILTLDVSAPFHEAMMLPVSTVFCHSDLRCILEQCSLEPGGKLDADELARRFVESLAPQDPASVEAFRVWLHDVATIGWNDRPGWAQWAHVLHRWGARGLPEELSAQAWAQSFLKDYQDTVGMRPLRAQAEALRNGPLSAWDAGIFARHRFYLMDEAEDGSDPFIPVLNTIEFVRLKRFHAQALALLAGPQLSALTEAAREAAEQMGLSNPAKLHSFQELQGV